MIYLDHAATTPVRREVLEAMWPYLTGVFGNPSSTHEVGAAAARGLADAREAVAEVLACRPGEVTFTSGGTEADNVAVKGLSLANPRGRHLVLSPIEHEAVLESAEYLRRWHGFAVSFAPVDGDGMVAPDALAAVIRPDTALVSIQLANNEIGTVQPIAALAERARAVGASLHTDAVQAAGWLDLRLDVLGADAVSLAGHKIGAPKGSGALIARSALPIEPVLHGGGQERGRRSGTENVAGAVAFATALRLAEAERIENVARVRRLRDALICGLLTTVPSARLTGPLPQAEPVPVGVPSARLTGSPTAFDNGARYQELAGALPSESGLPDRRLPGVASFVFPGTSGEAILLELERDGIVCSSGSACAAGSTEPSHVLTAIGLAPEISTTAVRFTLGRDNTDAEIAETIAAVGRAVAALGRLGR